MKQKWKNVLHYFSLKIIIHTTTGSFKQLAKFQKICEKFCDRVQI